MFKNESFSKFAPYLLDKPRTILEVSKLSRISRRTISEILGSFKKENGYDSRYIGWYGGSEGLKIKTKLLSDYLSQTFGLSPGETEALDELISQDSINKAISNQNLSLDMAIMKVIVLTMIVAVRNQIELDDPKYYEREKYFKEALETAYKKAPPYLVQDIKKLVPKGGIPMPFGLDNAKNEAIEPWLKEYIKKNRKQLESILVKMKISTFPIIIFLSDLYDSVLLRFGGVLYIKRQLGIGNKDWIEQYTKFRAELKNKRNKKGEKNNEPTTNLRIRH